MLFKERTKSLFADALTRLLENKSLDKIRVLDMAKECGATPQTVYYHFHDKYELLAWMFLRDFMGFMGLSRITLSAQRLTAMMQELEEKRGFYQKALPEELIPQVYPYVAAFMEQVTEKALTQQKGAEASLEERLDIRYHIYGTIGLLADWIHGRIPLSAAELQQVFTAHTPAELQAALDNTVYFPGDLALNKSKNKKEIEGKRGNK